MSDNPDTTLIQFQAAADKMAARTNGSAKPGQPALQQAPTLTTRQAITPPPQQSCIINPDAANADIFKLMALLRRYAPKGPIATAAPFGDVSLGLIAPGEMFDVPYDPLTAMLADPALATYLVASATESGGSMTATIAHSAQNQSLVRAFRVAYDTDPDQSGMYNALETVTWNPEQRNGVINTTEDPTSGVVVVAEVSDTAITARVTLPPTKQGGYYLHTSYRTTSLPKTLPMRAVISAGATPAGDDVNLIATMDAAFATTGLTSGSVVHKTVSVIAPGSPYFEEYVDYMLRNYYRAV